MKIRLLVFKYLNKFLFKYFFIRKQLLLLLSLQSCPTLCDPRRQPTRLPRPWDFPGKNTSGLPFPSPMQESEKWKWSRSVVSDSSRPHGLQPTRLLRPWDFPGKSTGVGCHCLLWTMKAEHICYTIPEMCKKVQRRKQIWYFVVFVVLFLIYLNVYNKIEIIKYI